jgi:microcystin-dependent protein
MSGPIEPSSPPATPGPVAATLTLPQLVASSGLYPRGDGPTPAYFYLGMVHTFAGTNGAFSAPPAQGQLERLSINTALFSLFGTMYGGDGQNNFALPNLRGRIPVGGDSPGNEEEQTLCLRYIVAAGAGGAPVGSVALFGSNFAPPGWLFCDGGFYSPEDYPQLYEVIGTTFGSNEFGFAMPNLNNRAVVGAGNGPGLPPVTLGQNVGGTVPGLGLTMMICVRGAFPRSEGNFPDDTPFVGQTIAFGRSEPPAGWLPADGRLLPIAGNQMLFAIIGNTYGGDSVRNFALPDLRGRMMVGS